MGKGSDTRTRILDIAQDAVLAKGFDATSIDEIVAAAEITKGGFFYHFRDKGALAVALLERYVEADNAIFDGIHARARQLVDDPLQQALIGFEMLAETLEDMPNGHPGCLVASIAYQDRLFDARVRDLNREAVLGWRERFKAIFADVAAVYPPNDRVDPDALADMATCAVEGGIVLAKAFGDPLATAKQVRLVRSYVKLLFSPRLQ